MAHTINDVEQYVRIAENVGVSVVKFSAEWCAPCKKIAPAYAQLVVDFPTATFYTADVDELSTLVEKIKIKTVPTFLIISDGHIVNTIVGANIPAVKNALQKL